MKIIVAESYESMSQQAADEVVRLMDKADEPLICTASGDSPAGLYKHLVAKVRSGDVGIAGWFFIGLDEWEGMNGDDEGSCRYHLNKQLFGPLQVKEEKISFFDGRADADGECRKAESFIEEKGGIEIAIVGLGMNGHIGMNEPGTPASLGAHMADIDAITRQVGQKYFHNPQTLSRGITLGIADIMKAKHVFLLVSGKHKAGIVRRVIESEISEELPAGLLKTHPGFVIYLDKEAASLIRS
jgi:glucosamine-6-phosphate isomerase